MKPPTAAEIARWSHENALRAALERYQHPKAVAARIRARAALRAVLEASREKP